MRTKSGGQALPVIVFGLAVLAMVLYLSPGTLQGLLTKTQAPVIQPAPVVQVVPQSRPKVVPVAAPAPREQSAAQPAPAAAPVRVDMDVEPESTEPLPSWQEIHDYCVANHCGDNNAEPKSVLPAECDGTDEPVSCELIRKGIIHPKG
jgi:hypothetical protein